MKRHIRDSRKCYWKIHPDTSRIRKDLRFSLMLLIIVAMVIVSSPILMVSAQPSIWPMFRHDARHTGRSPYLGAQEAAFE